MREALDEVEDEINEELLQTDVVPGSVSVSVALGADGARFAVLLVYEEEE